MAHDDFQCLTGRKLIQQKLLRQKLGNVSAMFLFRHKKELPAPMLIGGRRFWLENEVDAYIDRLSETRNSRNVNQPDCAP
jgi:predicted DNA-binding transcriptional regulator AlpA